MKHHYKTPSLREYKSRYKRLLSFLKNDKIEWIKLSGFSGYYINKLGEIAGIKIDSGRNGTMKLHIVPKSKFRYWLVSLTTKSKRTAFPVHRLLAKTFLGKPKENQTFVRHLNHNVDDNRIENLAWGTPKENSLDQYVNGSYVRNPKKITSLDE